MLFLQLIYVPDLFDVSVPYQVVAHSQTLVRACPRRTSLGVQSTMGTRMLCHQKLPMLMHKEAAWKLITAALIRKRECQLFCCCTCTS